eukprot:1192208-Prorocentrum_minimum.AAC.3
MRHCVRMVQVWYTWCTSCFYASHLLTFEHRNDTMRSALAISGAGRVTQATGIPSVDGAQVFWRQFGKAEPRGLLQIRFRGQGGSTSGYGQGVAILRFTAPHNPEA